MTREVIPAERRKRILVRLRQHGSVRVSALSGELAVSDVTIRRDLAQLESEGILERTHGGAVITRRMEGEPEYTDKDRRQREGKRRIGRRAADIPEAGATVFVNSGSTNGHVLRNLAERSGLRIITSNAAALSHAGPGNELIVVGGTYRAQSNSLVGPLANQHIRQMHADHTFLGVDGISAVHGLSTPSPTEGETARLMIEQTRGSVVVVADRTKLGVIADFATAPLSSVDLLITDEPPPADFAESLSVSGVRLLVAGPDGGADSP